MPDRDRRNDLPGGTVTLLCTDVQSSTETLRGLGDDYAAALDLHRAAIRAACATHGGSEVDTQGDAFLFAFPRARDAIAAAIAAQHALRHEAWPSGAELRVRMGVHTGEPQLAVEGYVGIDVHLAARICHVASGGQILASRATVDVAGAPPPDTAFRDLGDHRLKDFEEPQRLFQVDAAGLRTDHPPLRGAATTGLPILSNRLVGRRRELAALGELFDDPHVRLVTLTGAGGTGKSRLALELAWSAVERFRDGVVLVRLAPVADPERVPSAIAGALGVRGDAERPLLETIAEHLRERELLMVLDNVEHVLPAAPSLGVLLAGSASLRLLATGRSPLGLSGERVFALDPLPDDDAAALFVERAIAADRHFDSAASRDLVREICRRLDGLPLAIELAAARVSLLPLPALLRRLDLAMLSGGPADRPERQRTLRATIDWSYGLLTPEQRSLHAALSVFAGGCSLDAVEAVCAGENRVSPLDDLDALVTGSLLRRADVDDEPRFRMLEVVRQFALEELRRNGDEERQRGRHADWVAQLAAEAEPELIGPDQARWLERLERELPNVRAALDWSRDAGRADATLRTVTALGRFWRAHAYVGEARERLAEALSSDAGVPSDVRASGLWWAGHLAMAQGDADGATPLLERALALFRALELRRSETFALAELGLAAAAQGNLALAEERCTEALAVARELDDARALSAALGQLAHVASTRGDHGTARELLEEALMLRRRLGNPILVANAANNLGVAALAEGDVERARAPLEEALELSVELGDAIHIAGARCALGQLALLDQQHEQAWSDLTAALEVYATLDDPRDAADCVSGLAAVAAERGDSRRAARLWGCADALRSGPATGVAATLDREARPRIRAELGTEVYSAEARAGAALSLANVAAELAALSAWATRE